MSFPRRKALDATAAPSPLVDDAVSAATAVARADDDATANDAHHMDAAPSPVRLSMSRSATFTSSRSSNRQEQRPDLQASSPVRRYLKAPVSPMKRLRQMMRSQSDGGLEIDPEALRTSTPSETREAGLVDPTAATGETLHDASDALITSDTDRRGRNPADDTAASPMRDTQAPPSDASAAAVACDVFLNASIQLLHAQSDARQRVRQLWFTIQRLRWETQLSDSGVELLHTELLAIMKSFNLETLDGARFLKTGYLTLVQAPDMVRAPPPLTVAQTLFGSSSSSSSSGSGITRLLGQRMWCTLSEEFGKLELTPVRDETRQSSPPPATSATAALPSLAGLGAKLKLPTSLSWLLTDALQSPLSSPSSATTSGSGVEQAARTIKLHGCQVRTISVARPPHSTAAASVNERRHQIQILVPNVAPSMQGSNLTTAYATAPLRCAYSIYAFEVDCSSSSSSDSDSSGESECEAWRQALDRVCNFHLYTLERSIQSTTSSHQYCAELVRHLPLCISLAWLRNRIDRYDPLQHSRGGGSVSQQHHQQMLQQHQQQQRRSSKNVSMIQIIKDLERDQVLVDQQLLVTGSAANAASDDSNHCDDSSSVQSMPGTIANVVKYIVLRVMAFAARNEQRVKRERIAATSARACARPIDDNSNSSDSPLANAATPDLPTSPTNRFAKYTEARALAFVERVLRGSSRTQSGGDIYDAISAICQHKRVAICPVSHDACPVQLTIVRGNDVDSDDSFQVDVHVRMRFKVVEMAPLASVAAVASPTRTTTAPATSDDLVAELPMPRSAESSSSTLDTSWASPSSTSNRDDRRIVDEPGERQSASTATAATLAVDTHELLVVEAPHEWAVLEGTLTRSFTLGRVSAPGTVTIASLSPELQ